VTIFSSISRQIEAPGTAEDRAQEFVAVEGGRETTSAEALVVVAYGLFWLLLLGFLFMTWRRQRDLDAKIARLSAQVDRTAEQAPRGP
jgi:hypothetical protein